METMRDIKRRINSVRNTQKITRAMKMVAAAKLKKAQKKAENVRPFFNKTRDVLIDVFKYTREERDHPLLQSREDKHHLYIIITADRGLSGAYNARIIDAAENEINKNREREVSLLTIGRKGRDYFNRGNYNIISEYVQIEDYPDIYFAGRISGEIINLFIKEVIDRASIIYTHFNSAISQTCRVLSLLPVTAPDGKEENQEKEKKNVDYIYEPSAGEVLDILLPKYVDNMIYTVLLESKASEFGSRMTAMDAATDNAGELIEELTLYYNRARQAAITKEITEIVGGAEALK